MLAFFKPEVRMTAHERTEISRTPGLKAPGSNEAPVQMTKPLQELILKYTRPAGWEEVFYEAVRISGFAKLTPAVLWYRLMRQKPYRSIRSRADLLPYCKETLINEAGHLVSLVVMLVALGYYWAIGGQLLVAFLGLIVNVGINLLPIFLMRYNRIRIANLLDTTVRAVVVKLIR
jgi:hypothetical protein